MNRGMEHPRFVKVAMAAALAAAALNGCSSPEVSEHSQTSVEAHKPAAPTPEKAQNETVHSAAQRLADKILTLTTTKDTAFTVISSESVSRTDDGRVLPVVTTKIATLVENRLSPSESGFYTASVFGVLDPETGQVDPTKIADVTITQDTVPSGATDVPDTGKGYLLELTLKGDDYWLMAHRDATDDTLVQGLFTTGEPTSTRQALSSHEIIFNTNQAMVILERMSNRSAVDHVPN